VRLWVVWPIQIPFIVAGDRAIQVPISRLAGNLGTGRHLSGYAVDQAAKS
jgi:hypothetical protein